MHFGVNVYVHLRDVGELEGADTVCTNRQVLRREEKGE